jgi:hypothetical protein
MIISKLVGKHFASTTTSSTRQQRDKNFKRFYKYCSNQTNRLARDIKTEMKRNAPDVSNWGAT